MAHTVKRPKPKLTVDGNMVDLIAFNAYGEETGTTEILLDTIWDLPDYPPVLPGGVIITLPILEVAPAPIRARVDPISLWD